ncbi:hypothetical protein AK830_g8079 [Neonectria ditissima]|uniref:Uncharacterized protein n=1 Tax=Neonectria ditissima TaxID=78410 RepID=A0A0P7BDB7_9HYPO|nr:hypothetical protein AK830_g8079 [Neonectria ditissima]
MSAKSSDCELLVCERLHKVYGDPTRKINIETTPSKILGDFGVLKAVLYAQSLVTDQRLTIYPPVMPEFISFLRRLASKGVGVSDDYMSARYKFVERKPYLESTLATDGSQLCG